LLALRPVDGGAGAAASARALDSVSARVGSDATADALLGLARAAASLLFAPSSAARLAGFCARRENRRAALDALVLGERLRSWLEAAAASSRLALDDAAAVARAADAAAALEAPALDAFLPRRESAALDAAAADALASVIDADTAALRAPTASAAAFASLAASANAGELRDLRAGAAFKLCEHAAAPGGILSPAGDVPQGLKRARES
jgi:hypothetical protein